MNILIIGANGQIGKLLVENIATATTHTAYGMVRKKEQMNDIQKLGGVPILADLEKDFAFAYDYMDAIIFSAGSGGHTGPEKTLLIDQEAAIKTIELAEKKGVKRFIMVSTLGAGSPEMGIEGLSHYLIAKGKADDALQKSGLDYTIIRPTTLSNDEPTGNYDHIETFDGDTITRADVAHFITHILTLATSYHHIYGIKNGDQAIDDFIGSF